MLFHVVTILDVRNLLCVTSEIVRFKSGRSISSQGKVDTDNKQVVDNCSLDRVATVRPSGRSPSPSGVGVQVCSGAMLNMRPLSIPEPLPPTGKGSFH